ncbi:MAG: alpha/beta hydrolase family protein [Candidatus Thorarchaeota archaeon]
MEFKEKQYDGPYEVSEVEIDNKRQIFRGILYYPPKSFKKPYPLIIYFHDFPQLFTLKELVIEHQYLLDLGFAFLVFNFRGYRHSEGTISIESQASDSIKVTEFVRVMSEHGNFDINNINILAKGFGSYIALILCSQTTFTNKILLLCPILDLEKHVYSENFAHSLNYINRFLPGNIQGIENVDQFIEITKLELKDKNYNIYSFIDSVQYNKLKIILGEADKITPLSEVKDILKNHLKDVELVIIRNMEHDCVDDNNFTRINKEIKFFFQ